MNTSASTPIKRGLQKSLTEVLKIPPSPYMKKLGYGSGVAVYELQRSNLPNTLLSPWAIKKLIKRKNTSNSKVLHSRLKNEAEILRKLKHPNIVGFRAFVKCPEGNNILAMEECTSCLGDLIEKRQENELGPYPANTIRKVTLDIAQALEYLHDEGLLMHCDIKSYNVLTKGDDFTICKLCDFGVCLPVTKNGNIDLQAEQEMPEYCGTPSWCSPEVMEDPPVITTKADIYALGLVIWEMIALTVPLEEETASNLSIFSELVSESESSEPSDIDSILELSIKTRKRPNLPSNIELNESFSSILEIYFCCTHEEMEQRPSAKNLVTILRNIS